MLPIYLLERLIHLSVVSNRDYDYLNDDLDRLSIESYELITYENRTLKAQINFIHPNYISMNAADKDRLRVYFKETWFFIDKYERQQLPEETILYIEIVN